MPKKCLQEFNLARNQRDEKKGGVLLFLYQIGKDVTHEWGAGAGCVCVCMCVSVHVLACPAQWLSVWLL